jgi:hypothetical protein
VATERDPYRVLGVDPSADDTVIAGAYRALARRHHPDVSPHPDAERRMAEINAAWGTLRDPERRRAWDEEHGVDRQGPVVGGGGPGARPARGNGSSIGRATATAIRTAAPGSRPPGPVEPVAWRQGPNGEGAAGPPPGRPGGSVLPFGRHIGWSLHEIVRTDPGYLAWLAERPEGAPYRAEIIGLLAPMRGQEPAAHGTPDKRRGFLRR